MEVDVFLLDEHDRDEVAGLFGELARFHETWGMYADPVDIRTGRFPSGWLDRLVPVPVDDPSRSRTHLARCAERHDLVVAELVAGRDKDRAMIPSSRMPNGTRPQLASKRGRLRGADARRWGEIHRNGLTIEQVFV